MWLLKGMGAATSKAELTLAVRNLNEFRFLRPPIGYGEYVISSNTAFQPAVNFTVMVRDDFFHPVVTPCRPPVPMN